MFSLFVTVQLNGSRRVFSRTLGAASPPRVYFPLAWLFLHRLPPFTPITAMIEIGSAIASFLCGGAWSFSCAFWLHFPRFHELDMNRAQFWSRRRGGGGEGGREKGGGNFFVSCVLFFFCIFWCVFCFFPSFFLVWEESLAGARDGGESRVSVFTHSRLHVMSHWNQNSNFSLFLRSEFFSSRGWRFWDFFAGKGEKWGTRREKISSSLGPPEVRS